MEKAPYTREQINGRVLAFKPLVISTAQRIVRSGIAVDLDDLVQEGCLGLLIIIPKCRDWRWLAWWLKRQIPPYMWAAAKRLKGQEYAADLETLEGTVVDLSSCEEMELVELESMLEGRLTDEERPIVDARLSGQSGPQIAREAGVSTTAIYKRQEKVRRKLAVVMDMEGRIAA